MRDQGWSDEAIAIERDEAERLAEAGLIWPENWQIVQVFVTCHWSRTVGFERTTFDGISGQEIIASMLAHRVPRAQWTEVFVGVRVMAGAAKPVLNERR